GFRSLFSWIMLGGTLAPPMGYQASCFDPCSPGSCWAAYPPGTIPTVGKGFRSLFSWIMLGGPSRVAVLRPGPSVSFLVLPGHAGRPFFFPRHGALVMCFDPCSPGSCWAATNATSAWARKNRFRSLFSWIMLGGTSAHVVGEEASIVSILVLLDH